MKHYIIVLVLFYTVFAQEQNIPHELKILKEEMKEMKHYLHELKETIEIQNKVINGLTNQITKQEQEMTLQKEKIFDMNVKIELLNEASLFQMERIQTLTNQVDGIKNNATIYVQKLDLLAFFVSLDPNGVTALQYLRNYGAWIVNH